MFIDFAALKASVSFADVVSKLNLPVKQSGNQWRGPCPACNSGGDRALVITEGKGYFCFTAKKGGDQIALAAHILDVSVKDAASYLAEGTSTVPTSTVQVAKPVPAPARSPFDRAKYQAGLNREVPDLPKDLCERADIGISTRGALKGTVLPLYDKDTGEFICYALVTEIQLPKATVVKLKTA